MKKNVLALAACLLLGATATAAASGDAVQAVSAPFVFKVNGEVKELKSSPILVDGTAYLPVRETAGLLEYSLDYDEATRTISLDREQKKSGISTVEVLNEAPDLADWINVADLIRFYEGNGIRAEVSGDSSTTFLRIGGFGMGFPLAFEDQYKDGDIPKLYRRQGGKFSILVYKNHIFVNKAELNELGFPIEDEWLPAAELASFPNMPDFRPLDGIDKLKPVFLVTEQGIIRAMNSKSGVLLNKVDLKARGFIEK